MRGMPDDYDPEELAVSAQSVTVAGTDFMEISVTFPVQTAPNIGNMSRINLSVATSVPVVNAGSYRPHFLGSLAVSSPI